MGEELITSVRVNVKSFLFQEFWWSHYGFRPRYEDILQIQSDDKKVDYGAKLYTKGFVRKVLEGKDAPAQRYKEIIQEQFRRSIGDLLDEDRIIFSLQCKPEPLVFQKFSPLFLNGETITVPLNPPFSIYHPADYETFDIVEQAVRKCVREYAKIPFSEVRMVDERPSEEEARRAYGEFEREAVKVRGQKREIRLNPSSLAIIVGQDEVNRYPDIKYGIVGEDDHFYAELKDGSRYPIGKPKLKVIKNEGG